MSLCSLGPVLAGVDRPKEPADTFHEGTEVLLPFLQLLPQAHARVAAAVLKNCLAAVKKAGDVADKKLIGDVEAALKKASARRLWRRRTRKPGDVGVPRRVGFVDKAGASRACGGEPNECACS